ncbi:fibronectin type III domain-containing protein [Thermoproteota archaeon]
MKKQLFSVKFIACVIISNFIVSASGFSQVIDLEGAVKQASGPAKQEVSEPQSESPKYVPNEIIVKFKNELGEVAPALRKNGQKFQTITGDTNLDSLNKKYNVAKIEHIFKKAEQVAGEITAQKATELHLRAKEKFERKVDSIKQKHVKRADRVLSNIDTPYLGNTCKLTLGTNDLNAAIEEYSKDPNVEYAEPNHIYTASMVPNDPMYSQQWAHQTLQSESAWDITTGDSSVVVAIIDTGVAYDHEDLAANMWHNTGEIPDNGVDDDANGLIDDYYGYDFYNVDGDPMDDHGHGTHCGGISAAVTNNGIGIAGACPEAKIMAVKFLGYSGSGGSDIGALCIAYAADNGADVISNSWGGGAYNQTLEQAIDYAYSLGCFLVAAAGNNDSGMAHYPAAYEHMLSVGATDVNNEKAVFSNFGSWVDVAAPGVSIMSTMPHHDVYLTTVRNYDNDYDELSGTSMACPYVAGEAALILSMHPGYNFDQVSSVLRMSTDDNIISPEYIGTGVINSLVALNTAPSNAIAQITIPLYDGVASQSELIPIIGSATGTSYQVFYSDDNPYTTNWIQFGSGGYISDGELALLDPAGFSTSDYFIKLSVTDSNGNELTHMTKFYLDEHIMSGWPQELDNKQIASSPICADFDGDPLNGKEIFSVSRDFSNLCLWHHDGTIVNGWPKTFFARIEGTPAVADLDGDGDLEIVVTQYSEHPAKMSIFHHDGTEFAGWPKTVTGGEYLFGTPSIGDIDGDGELEIVAVQRSFWTYPLFEVIAFDLQSNTITGWPVTIQGTHARHSTFSDGAVALADIDKDGALEVVVSSCSYTLTIIDGTSYTIEGTYYLHVFNGDGSIMWSREVDTSDMYAPYVQSPSVGDVNNDGELEIFFGTGHEGNVYGFDHNGNQLPGWPSSYPTVYPVNSGITLANIDQDPELEIIFQNTMALVYCYEHTGGLHILQKNTDRQQQIWGPNFASSPVVGDIDGDGDNDIVVGEAGDHEVSAFDVSGQDVVSFPKRVGDDGFTQIRSTPTITDLDNDGDIEIVIAARDGRVYVWDFDTSYNPASMEWPMYQRDLRNTGCYPLAVDTTPPLKPFVIDEGDGTGSTTELSASWRSYDFESGINGYEYALGTSPEGTDVIGWTPAGSSLSATLTGLTLEYNSSYYFSVKAESGIGVWSLVGSSDGITVLQDTDVPFHLEAEALSSSQISLNWKQARDDEDGFKIERSLNGVDFSVIGTVGQDVTDYLDSDLNATTTYYYRVCSFVGSTNSAYSNIASTTTTNEAAAPSDLVAAAISASEIDLSWVDNSNNEDGFKVERHESGHPWMEIAIVGSDVTSYSDTGLLPVTNYQYRVCAFNASGNSEYSYSIYVTTENAIPLAPDNLTATAYGDHIEVNWFDNSNNEDGFVVERSDDGGQTFDQIAITGLSVSGYRDYEIVEGMTYYYRVLAYNDIGASPYSNIDNVTTLLNPPSDPSATALSSSEIRFSWVDNSTGEDGFRIRRWHDGYWDFIDVAANMEEYIDTGLQASIEYSYEVCAFNSNGESNYTFTARATTHDSTELPDSPSNVYAQATNGPGAFIFWQDNADNELEFKIERSDDGVVFAEVGTAYRNQDNLWDFGLQAGVTYYYRVRASNNAGFSQYSNTAEVTPLDSSVVPNAPTGLSAQAMSVSRIDLSWVDNSDDESGFIIERCLDGSSFVPITSVGQNSSSYSDTGLDANTTYYYRVYSNNKAGNSAYTSQVYATTFGSGNLPNAPSNLIAQAISSSQININWQDNSSDEDGFKIERKTLAGSYVEIATVAANTTVFSDNGLNPNTSYFYRVRAYNGIGDSGYSNEANATTSDIPPLAPSNLSATAVSSSQINIDWQDNSDNEDGFKVERKILSGSYVEVATVAADVTGYSDSGLSSQTTYFYRVRAYNLSGDSGYSNETNATTDDVSPLAPSNLDATAVSASRIDLDWQDNSNNEDGFKIERKTLSGSYVEIATVGANTTVFSDNGLNPDTTYFYRVRAYNGIGDSGYSNEANVTTHGVVPLAPSNLAAIVYANYVDLSWQDNSDNEIGFRLERSSDGGQTFVLIEDTTIPFYNDYSIQESTTYHYRVYAYNDAGDSGCSNVEIALTIPSTPANLQAQAVSSSQIDLSWDDNSAGEAGFKIEQWVDGNWNYITVGPDTTGYSDTGLDANTTYYYRVCSYNQSGDSIYTIQVSATTFDDGNPPNAPSNLNAQATSSSQININWQDNSGDEDGFKIERKTLAGSYVEVATVGADVTGYSDSGLSSTTTYFYRIRAYNSFGDSIYSNEANATTDDVLPLTPSNLDATAVSTSRIDLDWQDNSNNENGFKIERKRSGGAYLQIATISANVTSFSDYGLNPSTTYFYRVRAYNVIGNSGYSNEASATTKSGILDAPIGLVGTPISSSQIDLSWQDSSDSEDGFRIEMQKKKKEGFIGIATVGPNATSYSSTGLSRSSRYSYRVRAFNAASSSSYSNIANARTKRR